MTKKSGFSDISRYPEIMELCDNIRKADPLLHKVSKMIPYKPWNDPELCDDRWQIASMRYAYVDYNPIVKCLRTPLVRSSGFSRLEPGTHIQPHAGTYGDIFRLHYGLDIPEGDCQFRIGDESRHWAKGEFLLFNDLDLHEAWNRTEHPRTILILEIAKSSLQTPIDPRDYREWK